MYSLKTLSQKVIIIVVAIIAFQFASLSVGFAKEKEGVDIPFSEAFIPHQNVPGYPRLSTVKADSSGKVNANPQFMADRLAIINLVSAYAYLIDEGRWDDWANLFSDDVVFESTVPLLGRVIAHDKKSLMESVRLRYIEPGKTSIAVRRHTMGNIHVAEQTENTAKVRSYMLISSVPDAYHLKPVTTGTYNAELEKRNGRWIITRWYIETDGFVAPSPAYPGKGFNYTIEPSPTNTFPGHKGPAKALPGKVTLKNHAYSMGAGPLYKLPPEEKATWTDTDMVIIDYLTDDNSAAALLPEGVTTYPIPDLPGFAGVKVTWANYRNSSYGPYKEFIVSIPCLYEGELYLYVPFIYVTTDAAMAAGRETGGWPKKLADIDLKRIGNTFELSFFRNKAEITAKLDVGGKLFSTPLPAKAPVELGYPYFMTLVLPPPTGKTQETVPLPTMSLRWIPDIGKGAKPAIAQLVGAAWQISGDFYGTGNTSLNIRGSEEDPFNLLPVYQIVGGTFLQGDMSLTSSQVKVLKDWLKK
jgi:acetoacetate decarboxylase